MIELREPFSEDKIRKLKMGDMVEITGTLYTGRDAVHKWLSEGNTPPIDLKNTIIYHCGPVIMKKGKKITVNGAGPTTSSREEPYQAGIIERFGIRGVIGKGGMGEKTLAACKKFGAVYFHAVGGAAQVLAACIKDVEHVFGEKEFGSPEAIWKLTVEKFPVVVTMDSLGDSLHTTVEADSKAKLQEIFSRIGK